jgi:hypothetical protein
MTEDLHSAAIPWWQDDQLRLDSELAAMYARAPLLVWRREGPGFWIGDVPLWPFDRPRPPKLKAFVNDKPLTVKIVPGHAYPMVAPLAWPRDLSIPAIARGWTDWHLLPSGALCLLQGAASWDPSTLAADLIKKISGWYIEYHLMRKRRITRMTDHGIANDDSLDRLIWEEDDPPDK